jgi:AraC-like DNA-binding protein
MYQNVALSISPDGSAEAPIPNSGPLGPYGGRWNVSALSVVRGWSTQPMSYGPTGVFLNAYAVVLSLTPTRRRTTVDGALLFEGWTPPGAMRVQKPGDRVATEMFTPFDQIALYIPTETFRSILREQRRPADVLPDIIDPLWRVDKFVDASLRCAVSALQSQSRESCHYLSVMGRSIAAHLLYHYTRDSVAADAGRNTDGEPVDRAIQFIDANIEHSPTLAEMASAARLPIDRFRREFKAATRMSPHQYLIRRRVDRACELIAASRKPRFAEIALECGFADQSHLSTTFRRVLGVTPARFTRQV